MLTDSTATELAVADETVTFEIMGSGPERRAAEDEIISVARRFECSSRGCERTGYKAPRRSPARQR